MEQLSEQNFSLRMYMCFLLTYTLMFPFLKNHEIENIQRTFRGGCSQMSCKKIASENFGKFTGKSLGFCQLRILTLSNDNTYTLLKVFQKTHKFSMKWLDVKYFNILLWIKFRKGIKFSFNFPLAISNSTIFKWW